MSTRRYLGRRHFLIADGADVVERHEVVGARVRQGVDLLDGRPPTDERSPT